MLIGVALPLAAGLVLLFIGAEGLVRGSAALAHRAGIRPLVIGLTVVAFGTSTPEMVVSLRAAIAGNGDVALGNVVGSNIVNVGLILGLAALIRPLRVQARVVRIDVPLVLAVSLLALALMPGGRLSRLEGAALLALLVLYVGISYLMAVRERNPAVLQEFAEGEPAGPRSIPAAIGLSLAGLAMLVGGAELTVLGAVRLASGLGVSQALIGLTVVAIGTSLPELATSLVAAARGEDDLAIGNVVGSNVFNLLGILGAAAVARPLQAFGIGLADWIVMIAFAGMLLPLVRSGHLLTRREGAVLLAGYGLYLGTRISLAFSG